MSRPEYAVHRGVSAVAVHKAIKAGRISCDRDGRIDPVVADIQWAQNTRARVSNVTSPAARPAAAAPITADRAAAAALQRVRGLAQLAHDALAGSSFEIVAPLLRQALQAVPPRARQHVAMSIEVWDALTAGTPGGGGGGTNDFSDAFMETFWYQVALGPSLTDHQLAPTSSPERAGYAPNGGTGETGGVA